MSVQKYFRQIQKSLSQLMTVKSKSSLNQPGTISIGLNDLRQESIYITQKERRVNMDSFIGPTEVEKVMRDITTFWDTSKAPEKEKIRILQLVEDYYRTRNLNDMDIVISNLCKSVLQSKGVMDNPEII
tara:strand:- start:421 stop:807 length:387 start_codon:yes stop_codon:yes gene_type:complete